VDDSRVLFKATDEGTTRCTRTTTTTSATRATVADDSSVLRADGGGGDTIVPFIGAIGAGSSLDVGNVLATIGNSGTIGAICGGSSSVAIGGDAANLDASALRVGSDNIILGMGDFGTGGRCSSGDGAQATGKGSDILRMGDSVILPASGGILGTRSGGGGGPNHVAIHDLLAPRAFTIAAPSLCAHKESRWSFVLLPGRRSTSDLTHHQRSKMLLSLSESR
jgi:hypothetical protein